MIGPGPQPQDRESGRWVAVTLLAAVLPPVLTQVGEGVREYLQDRRKRERQEGEGEC